MDANSYSSVTIGSSWVFRALADHDYANGSCVLDWLSRPARGAGRRRRRRRPLERKPTFLQPEYPFEWAGTYELAPGHYQLHFGAGPDATCKVALGPTAGRNESQIAEAMFRSFSEPPVALLATGDTLTCDVHVMELQMPVGRDAARFELKIETGARYTLLTQHLPEEFAMQLLTSAGLPVVASSSHAFVAAHSHDDSVTSVSFEFATPFHETRLNNWISKLLREQGTNIFRMKGILDIAGSAKRYVFQGVHMLFDGQADRAWGDTVRQSQLVFIGRELNGPALREGLESCLA